MSDDPLVSTDWLQQRLSDPKIRIVDASFKMPGVTPLPIEDYRAAHIPGAVFFPLDDIADRSSSLPHMFPDAAQFARDVGELGIGNDDTVVVYDAGTWMAAPRVWWMFLSFGHGNVRVLNGGLKKWRAEGRAVESGEAKPTPAIFSATFDPDFVRAKAQLIANLQDGPEQVVDARARERVEGAVVEPWPGRRPGRIPSSRNVPFGGLIDPETGVMLSLENLRGAFEGAGVDLGRPVVTTCGSGVSAAVLNLALYRLGIESSALYDGSWAEWGLPDGPPIATGPVL